MIYGVSGRIVSGLSFVAMLIVCAQLSGLISFLPPKPAAIIGAIGATITLVSERIQGGASSPQVRAAAEASDRKNEVR